MGEVNKAAIEKEARAIRARRCPRCGGRLDIFRHFVWCSQCQWTPSKEATQKS